MSATVGLQAKGRVLTLVGVGDVDTGMGVGFERVETGMVVVSFEGGEVERFEAGASAECFVEGWSVGVLCQCEERRGGCWNRRAVLSLLCASLVLFQYAWTSSAAWTFAAGSHVLSASGYPFHLIRNWSFLLRPK
jgi:hypothetical protein